MSIVLVNQHILNETGLFKLTAENGNELITEQQGSIVENLVAVPDYVTHRQVYGGGGIGNRTYPPRQR